MSDYRSPLCSVLVFLLMVSGLHAEASLAETFRKIKTGRKVEVTLISGATIKGRLGAVSNEGFTLEPASTLAFSDVRRVRATGLTRADKWIIFGVIWVAVGIIASRTT